LPPSRRGSPSSLETHLPFRDGQWASGCHNRAELWRSLIASFGVGITRDKAAVRSAVTEPWSNGQTEGQITKLKLVKRQMYGRAKLDLLQARLIGAA
jgi:transposase